jgi:hypothetical protein
MPSASSTPPPTTKRSRPATPWMTIFTLGDALVGLSGRLSNRGRRSIAQNRARKRDGRIFRDHIPQKVGTLHPRHMKSRVRRGFAGIDELVTCSLAPPDQSRATTTQAAPLHHCRLGNNRSNKLRRVAAGIEPALGKSGKWPILPAQLRDAGASHTDVTAVACGFGSTQKALTDDGIRYCRDMLSLA